MAEKWLTLLVHGVGEHKPGEMIDAVGEAFASADKKLPETDEYVVVHMEDKSVSRGFFPMFTRRFQFADGPELVFGEVFWADLSRIRGGTFDLIVAIFRLIFGLRYVSDQAATQPGMFAWILRRLIYVTIFIARGPLLALATLGAVFSVPIFARWAGQLVHVPDESLAWLTENRCEVVLGLVAGVVGGLLRVPVFKFPYRAFADFLFLFGLTIVILCNRDDFLGYLNQRYENQLGTSSGPACYLAAVTWLADWTRDAAFACLGLSLVALILALAQASIPHRAGLAAAYQSAAFQLLLWQLALAPLAFVTDLGLASVTSSIGHEFVRGAAFYVGFRILLCYLLAAILLAIWLVRMRWDKTHAGAEWPRPFPPRLIVGLAARIWVVLISIVLILESASMALREITDVRHVGYPKLAEWFLAALDWPIRQWVGLVWAITIVVLCATLLCRRLLRNSLHVATDVVNHFYRPDEDFPVRQQIESRFHKVFARLLEEYQPTRVTVIAHSQGTVISFNALAHIYSQAWFRKYAQAIQVELVTVGSPLTHLYKHYFPTQYPLDDKGKILQPHVKRWRNLFRSDDYVGTFVTIGPSDPQSQTWPENIPAKPGGHTDYWEPDIFAHLTDLVP